MATYGIKSLGKSKLYKKVYQYRIWDGSIKWYYNKGYYDTERQAALAVDKDLLRKGLNPVNILKSIA